MGMTIAQKILKAHLVDGEMALGQEIGLKIDQTLTQDATGTMAYLQFEAMGVDQVKTERSVAYIDTIPCSPASRMRTTTNISVLSLRSTASTIRRQATASAIRCIWSASASPAKPCLALTATPPQAAVSGCLRLAQAVWM